MIKRDYSGCTHPDCEECKCKDCIINNSSDFTELKKYRKEHEVCTQNAPIHSAKIADI